MADTKITALTALTAADPSTDVLPIVDTSDTTMAASGTTKKISINNILGASGTATLASATISGNLTVDTSTFAVDAANNRVFVGTAPVSTAYPLFVTRGGTAGSIAQFTDGTAQTLTIDSAAGGLIVGNANNGYVAFTANGLEQYRIAPLGVFTWADGAGGTRMTLNSSGLGVGASPSISGGGRRALTINSATGQLSILELAVNGTMAGYLFSNASQTTLSSQGATFFSIETNNTERFRVDSSGNVGIGAASPNISASGKALTIAGAFTRSRLELQNTDGGTAGVTCGTISWFNGSNAIADITGATNSGSATLGSLAFSTGGSPRLTIDSSGNVGIGVTPSASHILSCAGPIGISGTNLGTRTSYISNSGACAIYYTDGGGSGYFTDFGNLIIQPRTSAARSVVIATGSTTPVERAVVKSTGQVRFVPLASDPSGAEAGDVYYNSTSNKLKCYNGTTWNDLF